MKVLVEEYQRKDRNDNESTYYLYLESDEKQFVLKEYNGRIDGNGKDQFTPKGYFSSIEGAIKHLVKMKLMESTATTLSELLSEVKDIKGYIESKVNI